jgi:EAL domain-containing protein (putative c-di-GMP-specific phosphodiesterase class I)
MPRVPILGARPLTDREPMSRAATNRLPDLPGWGLRLRPGFLISFSVAGLIAIAALAFAVSRIMGADIRNQQLASATQSAQLLAAASFTPDLVAHPDRLDVAQLRGLDQAVLAARTTNGLQAAGVWSPRNRILYATNHRLIGVTVLAPAEVRAAFSGQTTTIVHDGAASPVGSFAGQQIAVAVPIYKPGRAQPFAVTEILLPYATVAQSISRITSRIDYILIGAAVLFYAALLPRLVRASRALRSQVDPRKQALLREFELGMKRDELELHYQPSVALSDGSVAGVEALLRWRHPKRGLLAPSEFLSTVAGGRLIGPLALHIVERALRDCAQWRARGVDAGVNVNLAVANALDGALPERIGRMLATDGIPADALGLEITESAIAADPEKATAMLDGLDRMGVRIVIDNFGTGYSSLAGLRDLPVTELKVDRSFVTGLLTRPRDAAIVRCVIGLAHELGAKVIAEGVEDEATLDELASLGCDMAQGYYFTRPMPLGELVAWFESPLIAGRAGAGNPPAAAV